MSEKKERGRPLGTLKVKTYEEFLAQAERVRIANRARAKKMKEDAKKWRELQKRLAAKRAEKEKALNNENGNDQQN